MEDEKQAKLTRLERLRSRVENWKFKSALSYLDPAADDAEVCDMVGRLAHLFGNSGWLDDGDIGSIAAYAVQAVLDDIDNMLRSVQ